MKHVEQLLRDAVGDVFPGAALAVSRGSELVFETCVGAAQILPVHRPLSRAVLFDIASLTKVVAATPMAMCLVESGLLQLDHPLEGMSITPRQLLAHTSGLPAWHPFFLETQLQKSNDVRNAIFQLAREMGAQAEPGEKRTYSDVGFIVLTELLEQLAGETIETWCERELFSPLNLENTHFGSRDKECAATEVFPDGTIICGQVHDENARAMGGVSGHAGVFSTASDVARFARAVVAAHRGDPVPGLPTRTVRQFSGWAPAQSLTLGWDTRSPVGSSCGDHFSDHTIGHLAFTGCSLWIDLEKGVSVVLLSNRVHPSRLNDKIKAFRPVLHNAVMEELGL